MSARNHAFQAINKLAETYIDFMSEADSQQHINNGKPFFIVREISETPDTDMQGDIGADLCRIQIDIHATNIATVDTLKSQVKQAIKNAHYTSRYITSRAFHDVEMNTRGRSCDFLIWQHQT